MTPAALLSLGALGLFSLADLRYRVAPGAPAFFLGAVLLAAPADPVRVGLVVLAVGWGTWRGWPALLGWLALLHPAAWAVLLAGAGARRGLVGRADLLALGAMACLFDWPGAGLSLAGVEVWRWFWQHWPLGPDGPGDRAGVPALPGMLLGMVVYFLWRRVNT
jgi:hypothetical protein